MKFRGGEFPTGTKGNFQPELTPCASTMYLTSRYATIPLHFLHLAAQYIFSGIEPPAYSSRKGWPGPRPRGSIGLSVRKWMLSDQGAVLRGKTWGCEREVEPRGP